MLFDRKIVQANQLKTSISLKKNETSVLLASYISDAYEKIFGQHNSIYKTFDNYVFQVCQSNEVLYDEYC